MTTSLAILADTHMPRADRSLPGPLLSALTGADMIVHLGDFTGLDVVELLERSAPLVAVHGNNDEPEVRKRFPAFLRLTLAGYAIAMLHGHLGGRTAVQAARAITDADIVLFGHSHRPTCRSENGRLLFNPGSPTDRRMARYPSYGAIELGEDVRARIIPLL